MIVDATGVTEPGLQTLSRFFSSDPDENPLPRRRGDDPVSPDAAKLRGRVKQESLAASGVGHFVTAAGVATFLASESRLFEKLRRFSAR